jgi:hypothetical protein
MRGTVHQAITIRGKARSVMVERREIGARLAQDGREEVSGYVGTPQPSSPVCDRPIAREVAHALSGAPIRFPGEWFRGGEG